jgi:flagellar hook-length control protein FliK
MQTTGIKNPALFEATKTNGGIKKSNSKAGDFSQLLSSDSETKYSDQQTDGSRRLQNFKSKNESLPNDTKTESIVKSSENSNYERQLNIKENPTQVPVLDSENKDIEIENQETVNYVQTQTPEIEPEMFSQEVGPALSPLNQRLAMKNFLLKMKTELNVQPDQIIAAFGNLSTEELLSPPEQSIKSLLTQFDLNEEETIKAEQYFNEMLQQTASQSLAEYVKDTNSDISIQVLSKKELQNSKIQKDISNLSQNFFVKPEAAANKEKQNQSENNKAIGAGAAITSEKGTATSNSFFPDIKNIPKESTVNLGGLETVNPNDPSINPMGLQIPEGDFSINSELGSVPNEMNPEPQKLSNGLASLNFNSEIDNTPMESSLDGDLSELEFDVENLESEISENSIENQGAQDKEVSGLFSLSEKKDDKNKEDGKKETSEETLITSSSNQEKKISPKEFVINQKPTATASEEAANAKEIVNHARVMIKDGGGEMKIRMTPHGLGEVTMKVNVQNGNVNVEMLADSQEAKKMLEKGLSELKATLASHKLNVENIKVDTSSNLMSDLSEKHRDAERQFAQNFMGEFRRNNQSWRDDFIGFTGARAYKSQTQDEAENPLLRVNNYKRSSGAEGRLNLVA